MIFFLYLDIDYSFDDMIPYNLNFYIPLKWNDFSSVKQYKLFCGCTGMEAFIISALTWVSVYCIA